MATKKYIQRQLPADRYKLVDSYSLSPEDYMICENCGKIIRNIGIVENSKGKRFAVGLDCAATLSGIGELDIEYYNNGFNIAKTIRAKVRKQTKQGATVSVQNQYYSRHNELDIIATIGEKQYTLETVSTDFIKKYLPELAKIARINEAFTPVNDKTFKVENGGTFEGYSFRYEVRMKKTPYSSYPFAYAEISKDGVTLLTGSNGGQSLDSCQTECARLYNKVAFAAGLHQL